MTPPSLPPRSVKVSVLFADTDLPAIRQASRVIRQTLNRLIRLQRNPGEVGAQAQRETPGGLPADVWPGLPELAAPYAAQARGGVRSGVTPLCPPLYTLSIGDSQVRLWTPDGERTGTLHLGNFQRHLLQAHQPGIAHLLETKEGTWALRFYLNALPADEGAPGPETRAQPPLLPPDPQELQDLEREGQYPALIDRLSSGPADQLTHRDQARLALAEWFTGQTDAAELKLLRLQGQPPVDARVMLGLSLVAAHRSDAARRLQMARQGLENGPDRWTRPYLLCSAGRALIELGQPEEALDTIEQALGLTEAQDLLGRARGLYYLQNAYATLEHFDLQEQTAREALRLFELLGIRGEQLSLTMDLAYRRFYNGDREEATRLIDQAVSEAQDAARTNLPTALLLRAEFRLLDQDFQGAEADLLEAQAQELHNHQDRLSLVLQAYLLECRWRLGQLTLEQFVLGAMNLRPLSRFDRSVVQFYRGLTWLLNDQTELARTSLEESAQGVALLDSFRLRAEAMLLDVARREGRLDESSPDRLLGVLERVGGDLALELDREMLADLYRTLAEQRWGGQRLARLALSVQSDTVLRLRTLGEFGAWVGQDPVQIRLAKGRELLTWLALHGSGTREELQTALWDGQQSGALISYFKQALRAVRDALSPYLSVRVDAVTYTGGTYALNPQFTVRVDLLEICGDDDAAAVEAVREMRGTFLPGTDTEWAEVWRQQAQAVALLRCLDQAARSQVPADAAQWYTRATEIDPLDERGWKGLIETWVQAGDQVRARRAQIAGRIVFETDLGMVPEFLNTDYPPVN